MQMDRADPIDPERFTLVLVDFDHTLFGANSTELFIKHSRPQWMSSALDIFFRKIVPWKWIIASNALGRSKDYACVRAIMIAMPWTLFAWRRKAPLLFRENKSLAVEQLLSRCDPGKVSIITFGFAPIIEALVAQSRWAQSTLIATPARASFGHLKMKKTEITERHYAREAIAAAFFITDSDDDRDLVASVKYAMKIVPQGISQSRQRESYLPLKYVALVKYGRLYVLDQFLFIDLCMWLLSILSASNGSLLSAFSAGVLLLSLGCIYEIGYYENDIVASEEDHPVLTDKEWRYIDYPIRSRAWLWAGTLLIIAEAALILEGIVLWTNAFRLAAAWMILLLSLRIVFRFYNRLSVELRLFVYPLLQAIKYFSPLIFFALSATGFCLLLSQIFVMSINYAGYRLCKKREFIDRDIWRALVFASLCLCLLASGRSLEPSSSIIFVFSWLAIRVCKPFIVAFLRAKLFTSARA